MIDEWYRTFLYFNSYTYYIYIYIYIYVVFGRVGALVTNFFEGVNPYCRDRRRVIAVRNGTRSVLLCSIRHCACVHDVNSTHWCLMWASSADKDICSITSTLICGLNRTPATATTGSHYLLKSDDQYLHVPVLMGMLVQEGAYMMYCSNSVYDYSVFGPRQDSRMHTWK